MKQFCISATLFTLLAASIGSSQAQAQQQGSIGPVAIIDMSYIFKNHERFKGASDRMRQEVLAAEEQLKARRTEIEGLMKQLENFKKDSPDYKQLDTDLTRKKIDLNAAVAMQKKEFVEREAKMYFNVYQEVLDATKLFADRNGIALVLRFNGDPSDADDPQDILKQLNKSVVYYHQSIDITPHVLRDLNRTPAVGTNGPVRNGFPPQGGPTTGQLPPRTGVPQPPRR